MHAGALRHRITIQQIGSGRDTDGHPNGAWADYATVWGEVKPLSGREKLAVQQVDAEITHQITIRFLMGMVAKMRIQYGTRIFDVKSVLNTDERNYEMRLLATEKV